MTDLTAQKPHAARGRGALKLQTMTMGAMSLDMAMIGDEPWFYAPSLARTLGHKDARDMLQGVPSDEKALFSVRTLGASSSEESSEEDARRRKGGVREATFLSEPGFYRVVMRSRVELAEPFKRWVFRDVLPSIRKTGQYKMHEEAKRLGVTFDFTEAQWDWLKLHSYMVDLLVLAAAGYNSVQITRMLNYNTLTGITARKQIDRLKELGFLPKVIEPRAKQLERRIKAERAAAAVAIPAP